jgi:hypothetical protein
MPADHGCAATRNPSRQTNGVAPEAVLGPVVHCDRSATPGEPQVRKARSQRSHDNERDDPCRRDTAGSPLRRNWSTACVRCPYASESEAAQDQTRKDYADDASDDGGQPRQQTFIEGPLLDRGGATFDRFRCG